VKRWIARLAVPVMIGGATLGIASPVSAGQWVSGGHYEYLSGCLNVGAARHAHGLYERYACERDSPGYLLRGYIA